MAEIFKTIFQRMINHITRLCWTNNAIFMLRPETFGTTLVSLQICYKARMFMKAPMIVLQGFGRSRSDRRLLIVVSDERKRPLKKKSIINYIKKYIYNEMEIMNY